MKITNRGGVTVEARVRQTWVLEVDPTPASPVGEDYFAGDGAVSARADGWTIEATDRELEHAERHGFGFLRDFRR